MLLSETKLTSNDFLSKFSCGSAARKFSNVASQCFHCSEEVRLLGSTSSLSGLRNLSIDRNVTNPDVEGGDGFAVSGVTGWFTDFRTIICRGYFLLYFFGIIRSGGRQVTRRHGGLSSVREADVGICRVHFEHKADLLSRSHAGIDLPEVDRRGKASNRSWGVAFVEVHSNERTACKASGRTAGHCSVGSPCDFKANNGTPNKENNSTRHFSAEAADTSALGNANGNLEYSSTTINIYLWFWRPGSRPLKSMLRRSKGCVAFIKFVASGW
ncbi:hypothetical protein T11_14818 [Trichinella zimbabwensis]|uniref:Uncharacterized protein n=1 Tax=Trichinella zimbabwensis TaxID=268475 RepID=A0A0V1H295_9BILA|nr:hypothetical protein T11_14818 [Trichinella zimbabwensis]